MRAFNSFQKLAMFLKLIKCLTSALSLAVQVPLGMMEVFWWALEELSLWLTAFKED